jgi:DNA-binding NtrC family response regulator
MSSKKFPDEVPLTRMLYVGGRATTLHLRKCKFVLEREGGATQEFVVEKSPLGIGAMEDNDLVVEDDTVSRYHCRIFQEQDSYVVHDLESTNGTFVNGVRVKEAYLKPGCSLALGDTELKFYPFDEKVDVRPSSQARFGGIIGFDVRVREIFGILEKIAPTGATVVIEGETGTGKEVVAKSIHAASPRRNKPFMVFDCGAVPDNLIESELFGHEKGSFTGAIMTRQGIFELATGGTIFLDELGEMNLELQPKLLRVLEQREVKRVGSAKPIKVDVRVIAATNRDLEAEVAAGRFREDLYYRLSVVRIKLPPLRERISDLPLLVDHFLKTHSFNRGADGGMLVREVSKASFDVLSRYRWPGNVRELLNVIERAVSFAEGEVIDVRDLPDYVRAAAGEAAFAEPSPLSFMPPATAAAVIDLPFKEAKERWVSAFEKDYVMYLLRRNGMNISHAAKEAAIDRKYFRKLMRKYGIDTGEGDAEAEEGAAAEPDAADAE